MILNLKIKHFYAYFKKYKFLKFKNCNIIIYIFKKLMSIRVCVCVCVGPSVRMQ